MQSLFKSKACAQRLSLLKPSKWLRQPDGKEIKTNWVWMDRGRRSGGVSSVSYVAVWLWLFMFQKFLKSDEIWCFLHFFARAKFPPSPFRFWCPPRSSSAQLGEVGERAGENQGQDPTPTEQHPFFYFLQDYYRNRKKQQGTHAMGIQPSHPACTSTHRYGVTHTASQPLTPSPATLGCWAPQAVPMLGCEVRALPPLTAQNTA